MAGLPKKTSDQSPILKRAWQNLALRLHTSPLLKFDLGLNAPDRLLAVPAPPQRGDAKIARDIYAGLFEFAGESVETGENSPFSLTGPSAFWLGKLHGFTWLRHLDKAATPLARSNAQVLVGDWILNNSRSQKGTPWQVEVVANRIISWMNFAPLIIEETDPQYRRTFLHSIGAQARYLEMAIHTAPQGMPQLKAAISMAYAALCLGRQSASAQKKQLIQATRILDQQLQQQFLADGGHISRNPDEALQALSCLLPLHQLYSSLAAEPPASLQGVFDRALPMVSFFRHRDGHTALFNGAKNGDQDLLEQVLRSGRQSGTAPDNAVHSGYQRLSAGSTLIIADTGKALSQELSRRIHAGCLSFELSSGSRRFVVNCGGVPQSGQRYALLARSTAAHSTATLNDTSSCRTRHENHNQAPALEGITKVSVNRSGDENGDTICASHDGYLDPFNWIHERTLFLAKDGNLVNGADRFFTGEGRVQSAQLAIRFHLHPQVKAELTGNGISVLLQSSDGDGWKFTCIDARLSLEDSIFFDEPVQNSRQIVLTATIDAPCEFRWTFERTGSGEQSRLDDPVSVSRSEGLLDVLVRGDADAKDK